MLVLNRRVGEAIVLDGDIRIIVLASDRRGVRIGIDAPAATIILREELVRQVASENQRAGTPDAKAWAELLPLRSADDQVGGG